uniref:Uncharacterized protein n=1 Tax=Salmonella sp. TaxID=599 RepID=A0A482ETF2_SALSP|nr:hypothetical protein [Salmonella sp.]QBM91498.1 hypothetical protein NNIBIDOC_00169 [Salmonella sp.]
MQLRYLHNSGQGSGVMNNAGGDHSQAAIMDFARGHSVRPVGTQFIGKTDFCVFCIYSISDGQSYNKTGYSTKILFQRLSQGWQQFKVYRQQVKLIIATTFYACVGARKGQQFWLKGMLRQGMILPGSTA